MLTIFILYALLNLSSTEDGVWYWWSVCCDPVWMALWPHAAPREPVGQAEGTSCWWVCSSGYTALVYYSRGSPGIQLMANIKAGPGILEQQECGWRSSPMNSASYMGQTPSARCMRAHYQFTQPSNTPCFSSNSPPPPPCYTHTCTHAYTLLPSHDNHLSHPSHLHSVKIPPPLSSNLTFFSGADPGRPTLFPTARQKPALWSEPEPLRWFPLSSPFSLPWLPASPTALLYWFTPPTNAVCLCFAPPAPRSLISITLPSCPFSLFPSHILSFF